MAIYIGHVSNTMNCRMLYCGFDWAGHKNEGLGNKFKNEEAWQQKFALWLKRSMQDNHCLSWLMAELVADYKAGKDIFLQCWCFETPVAYERVRIKCCADAKCHTQIIAEAIVRMAAK